MIRLTAGTTGLLHEVAEGVVLPVAFGLNYQVPVIPVQAPLADRLAVALDDVANNPDLVLSTADFVSQLPLPCVLQIDQEVFIAYAKLNATTLTTVWRAEVAHVAAHAAGAAVYFRGAYTGPTVEIGTPFDFASLAPLVFAGVVAWNPRQATHKHRAVTAVYQNGIRLDLDDESAIRAAVTLDDRSLFVNEAGDPESVVSLRVDLMTDYAAEPPTPLAGAPAFPPFVRYAQFPPGTPQEKRFLAPPPAPRAARVGAAPGVRPIAGGAVNITTWPDGVMPFPATRPSVPLQIGTLTVDLEGVEDDDAGTVSGTPNLWLENPTDVVRCLAREAYGLTDDSVWDLSGTWAATRALHQARSWMRWHVLYSGLPFRQFAELAGYNGRAELYPEDGLWKYRSWDLVPEVSHEFTPRNVTQCTSLLVPFGELVTELDVQYDGNPVLRHARLVSEAGRDAYGPRPGGLNLTWLTASVQSTGDTYPPVYRNTTQEVARVARDWLRLLDRQLVLVNLTAPWDARHLQRGDKVTCRDLGLVDTGGVDALDALVRGRTYDPATGRVGFVLAETTEDVLLADAVAFTDALTVTPHGLLADAVELGDALTTRLRALLADTVEMGDVLRVTVRVRLADTVEVSDVLMSDLAATPTQAGGFVTLLDTTGVSGAYRRRPGRPGFLAGPGRTRLTLTGAPGAR